MSLPIEKKPASPWDTNVADNPLQVDRRKCRRTVPMKVLVLGQSSRSEVVAENGGC